MRALSNDFDQAKARLTRLLGLVGSLADLLLRLPARLVDLSLALEASIAGGLASGLLGTALRFVNLLCHVRLLFGVSRLGFSLSPCPRESRPNRMPGGLAHRPATGLSRSPARVRPAWIRDDLNVPVPALRSTTAKPGGCARVRTDEREQHSADAPSRIGRGGRWGSLTRGLGWMAT